MASSFDSAVGTIRTAIGGTIGVSGKPIRVFSVGVYGVGVAIAARVSLYNGTSASDTTTCYATIAAQTASVLKCWAVQNFEGGLLFPNGCFMATDTAIAFATVCCKSEE